MNCNQVKDNLSTFLDNELDLDQTNSIKAHLIRCKSCRDQRDQMENLGQQIRKLSPLTTPADFQFRVYSAIRRKESATRTSPFRRWQTAILTSAAMLMGVFIGIGSNNLIPALVSTPAGPQHHAISPAESSGTMYAADTHLLSDEDVIRDYNLDSYIRQPMIPVTVDTIPDTPNSNNPRAASPHTADFNQEHPEYVLDNVPMRVSYERTIY